MARWACARLKAGEEFGGELAVAGGGGTRGIVLVDGLAVAGGDRKSVV